MIYLKEFNTTEEYNAFVESGQMVRPNVSLVNEPFTTYYNMYIPLGVFIQHVDGTLYTTTDWSSGGFSNDLANGVAVSTDTVKFVIAKNNLSTSMIWCSNTSTLIDGIFTSSKEADAMTDFAGRENTKLMLAMDTSGAGYSCANYTFPNGEKGYLPAMGEWQIAHMNKSAINNAMRLIGGTEMSNEYFWTSTQYSATQAWKQGWPYGDGSGINKDRTAPVRAFAPLGL